MLRYRGVVSHFFEPKHSLTDGSPLNIASILIIVNHRINQPLHQIAMVSTVAPTMASTIGINHCTDQPRYRPLHHPWYQPTIVSTIASAIVSLVPMCIFQNLFVWLAVFCWLFSKSVVETSVLRYVGHSSGSTFWLPLNGGITQHGVT